MLYTINRILLAFLILVVVTIAVYYVQFSRASVYQPPTPIYIAKPTWYVTDREWHSNQNLYDGGNVYYSGASGPAKK